MPGSGLGHRRPNRFTIILLANLCLLALFAWALTETTTLRIEITSGECTAILDGGRTNYVVAKDDIGNWSAEATE